VPQRELPKQAANAGYHTCGYSVNELGVIDETRLHVGSSSEVTTIEPAEQMSDSPDMSTTSLIEQHTLNQIILTSSLHPQRSISFSSSAYNPFSDQLPAAMIT
jgi:hypothetical protein